MNPLHEAYIRTDYIIHIDSSTDYILNIGIQNNKWNQFLIENNFSFYFFITAWNPFSESKSETENNNANLLLKSRLLDLSLILYDGVGRSKDSDWYENSFCAVGGEINLAHQLGREFNQNAIVYGSGTINPTLLFL
jgi:hypothetical protein